MRLVDNKELTLEEDVRKYLPIFPYKGITIRMLLTHRSGVPYYGYFADRIWDHSKKMTNQDVLRLLNKLVPPLNFPSGTHFAYCNTNFALLALVIEKVTDDLVHYLDVDKKSIIHGKEEGVKVAKGLYNFHSHPIEAYERNNVKFAWPSAHFVDFASRDLTISLSRAH